MGTYNDDYSILEVEPSETNSCPLDVDVRNDRGGCFRNDGDHYGGI